MEFCKGVTTHEAETFIWEREGAMMPYKCSLEGHLWEADQRLAKQGDVVVLGLYVFPYLFSVFLC